MGMYDKERQLTKQEFAADGAEFVVRSAEYIGVVKSADYGDNTKARVTAAPDEVAIPERFVVFGVMAEQVRRMEPGDVPAVVRIGKDGRANVFELVRAL